MNDKKDLNKSNKEGWAHKAGDAVERVGQKISNAGATKTGKAIYDAGNKLEHSRDDKK